jgi:lactate 2-monooxygenase
LIRAQTNLRIAAKWIQRPDGARMAIDSGTEALYCTNHGGRQAEFGDPHTSVAAGAFRR